jgi:putative membrane-bound dehydrogenase-like protein
MRALLLLLILATPQDRKAPLPPDEALKTFQVAKGFRVELVASEPNVVSPVAMAFDEDGRLYVAEMRDYPLGPQLGTIRLLQDSKGDGHYDKSTVFADKIPFPTSVLPWKGGVLVTAAYEILYLKDTDGDGVADERKTLFTGFGKQNAQHVVNGLRYGLDNWIYGAAGLSGGKVGDVSINGTDFRFKLDPEKFESVSGKAQFGHAFDEWGRRFVVRHDNHIVFPVLPQKALARQTFYSFPSVEDSLSDHGNIPKLFPISPRDAVFTTDTDSSCGCTIWRGDYYVCEPVMNLVHRDRLVPKGASFTAKRIDEGCEFLASTDPWCRPVNLCPGPDGALYVADMQRAVIEHPDYIPKEIQKKLDMDAGKGAGRIYRVTDGAPFRRPQMSNETPAELVAHLEDPNPWWRLTAQRLIVERGDRKIARPLRALTGVSQSPLARLHALMTIDGLGQLKDDDIKTALRDPEPGNRESALMLGAQYNESPGEFGRVLADDPDPRVRFQLALVSSASQFAKYGEISIRIALRDSADPWIRAAVLTGIHIDAYWVIESIRKLQPDFLDKAAPGAMELVRGLAEIQAARKDAEGCRRWLAQVTDGPLSPWRREALTILPRMRREGIDYKSTTLQSWADQAAATLADSGAAIADRLAALQLLGLIAPDGKADEIARLLNPQEPQELQSAAIRTLAAWPGDPWGPKLFDGWATRTVAVRREILNIAIRQPERVRLLFDRIEKGDVRAVEIDATQRADLLRHPDAALRERAKKLLQANVSSDREEVIREIGAKLVGLKGDRARGEKVYQTNCATCHRLRGQGIKVGPDLEGVIGRDRKALLVDILDPNRAMDPSYQVYVIRTAANETFNGVIATETPASITLRRPAGEETTVLRKDIAEIKAWPASLMPEGVENNVKAQDFADLLEFLSPSRP